MENEEDKVRYAEVGVDDGDTGTSLERDLRMVKDNMKMYKHMYGEDIKDNPWAAVAKRMLNWQNVAARTVATPTRENARLLMKYSDKSDGEKIRQIANDLYEIYKEDQGKTELRAITTRAAADKKHFHETDLMKSAFWSAGGSGSGGGSGGITGASG